MSLNPLFSVSWCIANESRVRGDRVSAKTLPEGSLPKDCQVECQKYMGCDNFVFNRVSMKCKLYGAGSETRNSVNVDNFAGPRVCGKLKIIVAVPCSKCIYCGTLKKHGLMYLFQTCSVSVVGK